MSKESRQLVLPRTSEFFSTLLDDKMADEAEWILKEEVVS
jgi:hypothetical protein